MMPPAKLAFRCLVHVTRRQHAARILAAQFHRKQVRCPDAAAASKRGKLVLKSAGQELNDLAKAVPFGKVHRGSAECGSDDGRRCRARAGRLLVSGKVAQAIMRSVRSALAAQVALALPVEVEKVAGSGRLPKAP